MTRGRGESAGINRHRAGEEHDKGTGLLATLYVLVIMGWRCFICQEKQEEKVRAEYTISF